MEREDMDKIVAASEWKEYWESLINENTTLREHYNALVEAVARLRKLDREKLHPVTDGLLINARKAVEELL